MSRFGVEGVAAFAIVNYSLYSGVIFAFAIGDSLQPMVSHCLGARDAQRIRQFMRISLTTVTVVGLMVVGLFHRHAQADAVSHYRRVPQPAVARPVFTHPAAVV